MDSALKQLSPEEFPALLREIADPPKQLFLRGRMPADSLKWLAVVGSRALSPYGRQVITHLIEGLRGYPIVIVSGLAYGADSEAHAAAIRAGLTTVGIPGSGIDWSVIYPRANVALARRIVEMGGCLFNEFEPGFRATDYSFPQRNRIMAGVSHATLVIEAKERSGTLITARLATEYNRELLVVPGSIFSETSRGSHQFLKLGATPVTSPLDILSALNIEPRENSAPHHDMSPDEVRVISLLSTPSPRDLVIATLGMDTAAANVLLSTMELKGILIEEMGILRKR